jgi:hypothetical protein
VQREGQVKIGKQGKRERGTYQLESAEIEELRLRKRVSKEESGTHFLRSAEEGMN